MDARFYWVWPPSLLMYWLWRQYVAVRMRTAIFPATVIVLLPMARVLKQPSHDPAVRAASGHSVKLDFIMFGCMVTLLQGTPRFCVVRDIAEAGGLFLQ